jgi:alanine racemase
VQRSEITIDLDAIRHNARRLLDSLAGSELWAVVKANGYGHGASDVARAALEAGASALCVVTVAEAVELRRGLPEARIVVMCPTDEVAEARDARLELVVSGGGVPEDVPVHLKLDTGMGRWGFSELPQPPANVVGLMSHLATADSDPAFAQQQVERFRKPVSTPPAAGSPCMGSRPSTATRPRTGCGRRSRGAAGSPRCASSSRGRAPATGGGSSPSGRRGSGSSRSATPTASAGT